MKRSYYNIESENKNGELILCNTDSTTIVKITDPELISVYRNIENITKQENNAHTSKIIDDLMNASLINTFDSDKEEQLFMANMYRRSKYKSNNISLTIAPTMDCNFKCVYCFENREKGTMSEDTLSNIFNYIESIIESKKSVVITWFGGEPLISKNTIIQFNRRVIDLCKSKNKAFLSGIITNGFLITDKMIKELEDAEIRFAQITLDGTEEIHNIQRPLNNGNGTYNRIFNNIKLLSKSKIKTTVRCNIGEDNKNYVELLIKEIKNADIKNIVFSPAQIQSSDNYDGFTTCIENKKFAQLKLNLFDQYKNDQINIDKSMVMKNHWNYCSADRDDSMVINWNGDLYKCWNDIGNTSYKFGSINNKYLNKQLQDYYTAWDISQDLECLECKFLPLCMGGCPKKRLQDKNKQCVMWKYIINEYLYNY